MSGHSKWSKIKHQKKTTDALRGKTFTKLSRAITIAVKEGGGVRLRLAIDKARSFNMPKENIERAIERAERSGEGESLTYGLYEAFGPGGVGIIIEVATDNKKRTVAELKNVLDRGESTLAASGSVSHFFKLVGLINVIKQDKTFDEIMEVALEVGACDLEDLGETVEVYTDPSELHKIKEKIVSFSVKVSSFELFYRPVIAVSISDVNTAKSILKLLSALEGLDDVQRVFANFDIPDEYL